MAVGNGLQMMAAMFREDTERLCSPEGRLITGTAARPGRLRWADGGSWSPGRGCEPPAGPASCTRRRMTCFSSTEVLTQMALEMMLAGSSSRRYQAAGQAVQDQATATSKSPVSCPFAAKTETALTELMSRHLDDLGLLAFLVDGVHFGEHTSVVALGIGIDRIKHLLVIEEGPTENATLVMDLITGLRDRSWMSPDSSWTGPRRCAAGQGHVR